MKKSRLLKLIKSLPKPVADALLSSVMRNVEFDVFSTTIIAETAEEINDKVVLFIQGFIKEGWVPASDIQTQHMTGNIWRIIYQAINIGPEKAKKTVLTFDITGFRGGNVSP